ncbi:hypothetical protein [Rathayibacter oskolensis]|uniref:hypothetical protein n=1 Tax=Rathayibacter oskolensis TaxID=1891671 RepID=UPI003467A5FA
MSKRSQPGMIGGFTGAARRVLDGARDSDADSRERRVAGDPGEQGVGDVEGVPEDGERAVGDRDRLAPLVEDPAVEVGDGDRRVRRAEVDGEQPAGRGVEGDPSGGAAAGGGGVVAADDETRSGQGVELGRDGGAVGAGLGGDVGAGPGGAVREEEQQLAGRAESGSAAGRHGESQPQRRGLLLGMP